MKKRFLCVFLALILVITALPYLAFETNATEHQIVMTAYEFIDYLKVALSRKTAYNNVNPGNVGYYNGDTISWDCWNLGKTIIWTRGSIVNNYTVGTFARADFSCGLKDWTGDYIVQLDPNCNSDFTTMVPGEWLYMDGHTGYYIGDGQVIECTKNWGLNGVIQSQISSDGTRSKDGKISGKWLMHGKVPWLDYDSTPSAKKTYPAYCITEVIADTQIKSLPAHAEQNNDSVNIEQISKGSQFLSTKLVLNTSDELWYEVTAQNGTIGYLYAGDTAYLAHKTDDLIVADAKGPALHTRGYVYYLTGNVRTTYNKLTAVSAYVHSGNGTQGQIETGTTVSVNSNTYSLKNSTIDGKTAFGILSAGTHTYAISASYANYYAVSATTIGENTGNVVLFEAVFNVVKSPASCSHIYTESITQNPTCLANGKMIHTCSKCSTSYSSTIAAMPDHSYIRSITTAPTCTSTGTETYTCKTCPSKYTVVIPAANHSYHSNLTHPTCTTEGYTTYTCACGDSYISERTPATGHTYQKGLCINCGADDPDYSTLTGTITSFGMGETGVIVSLYPAVSSKPFCTFSVTNGIYQVTGVPNGEYRISFQKVNHATREYAVSLTGDEVVLNANIHRTGDINGDSHINISDIAKIYAHVCGTKPFTDEYNLLCANVTGGALNMADVAAVYAHIKGTKILY